MPAVAVEAKVRQIAQAGDRADLGHAAHLLADHQVAEYESRCGEHEQQDRVACAVDQAGHANHGKSTADRGHGGQADGERAENFGAAEEFLR